MVKFFYLYTLFALCRSVEPTYTFAVEFTAGSFTNITSRVERASWSSSIVDMFRAPKRGSGLFELANDDADVTPFQNAHLKPGKAVKLTATHGSSTYPLFFGRITEISFESRLGLRTTVLDCADDWDRVTRLKYDTGLFADYPVQSLFTALMSLSMVQSFSVDADISDRVAFAWYRDRDAANALYQLVQSGNYQLVVDGNGTYRLRTRHWSLFSTAVATYSEVEDLKSRYSQDSVINQARLNSQPRRAITDVSTVAFIEAPISIPASGYTSFWMNYLDPDNAVDQLPVSSFAAQVASADYYAAQNSDGGGANHTSTLSVNMVTFAAAAVVSLFNGHGGEVWLTRFQIHGYPVKRVPPISARHDIGSSQNTFGVREFTVEDALVHQHSFLEGLARVIVFDRHNGFEELKMSMSNEFPDVLSLISGDVFSLVERFTGRATQWRVRGVQHDLDLTAGLRHRAEFEAENFDNTPFLVLDHATFGQLDNGRVLSI